MLHEIFDNLKQAHGPNYFTGQLAGVHNENSPPRGGLPLDVVPFQFTMKIERQEQYSKSKAPLLKLFIL